MSVSKKIEGLIENASWIRRMFEEGARLTAVHGEDAVLDFSLGNPTLEPPASFTQSLREAVDDAPPGSHRYMPNPGYPERRAAVAEHLSRVHGCPVTAGHVVMSVGAAGALNCALKAILDPGDEVLVLAPYFPEYRFYADNHGASFAVAETTDDFDIDVEAVRAAVNERTRAVIINSPNNPTGKVYGAERLAETGRVLDEAQARSGRPVYLISDEPYRKIVYGVEVPSLFAAHANSIVCTSHSKDLGLPGERIGYAAINPACPGADKLFGAMAFTNRILGFVNAPALMQRAVAAHQATTIDPEIYRRKRDVLVAGLREAGYDLVEPGGAFYVFPRTPIPDDVEFAKLLARHLILAVPGVGFGRSGHMRLSYCVEDRTIERALPRFAEVLEEVRSGGRAAASATG